jgi:hypothetical protein
MGAFPSMSLANLNGTYQITSDNFGISCFPTSCGSVTIAGDGTTNVTFTVDITNALLSIHGIMDTFDFSVTSGQAASDLTATVSPANGTTWSSTVTAAGQEDGYGNFTFAVDCAGTGTGNTCGTQATISIVSTNGNITLGDSTGGATLGHQPFVVKLTAGGASTGFASVPGPTVGAGVPGLLAACGLLFLLARRRRLQVA